MNRVLWWVRFGARRVPLDVPLVGVLSVLAVLPLSGLYGSYGFVLTIAGGVLVLEAGYLAARELRLPAWIRRLIGIPLGLLYSVFALYPGRLTFGLPLVGAWSA